jgi:hypothetical protein
VLSSPDPSFSDLVRIPNPLSVHLKRKPNKCIALPLDHASYPRRYKATLARDTLLLHTVDSLLTIVKKIVEEDPDVLETVDNDDRNALNIACEVSSSSTLIKDLAYGNRRPSECSALHLASYFQKSTDIIVLLLDCALYALKMKNSSGEYPLRLVSAALTVGTLDKMIEGYPHHRLYVNSTTSP